MRITNLLADIYFPTFVKIKGLLSIRYFCNYFEKSSLPLKISAWILTQSIGLFCVSSPNTIENLDKTLISTSYLYMLNKQSVINCNLLNCSIILQLLFSLNHSFLNCSYFDGLLRWFLINDLYGLLVSLKIDLYSITWALATMR